MRPNPRGMSAAALLAAAALAIAACGSSSSTTSTATTTATTPAAPVALVGHSSSVVVNAATAQTLAQAGITFVPVPPATASTALVFPVTGGHVVVGTLAGTIDESGGLIVSHGGKVVQFSSFQIDTAAGQLSARRGQAGADPRSQPRGGQTRERHQRHGDREQHRDDAHRGAASELNAALGVSVFKGGMPFGIATLTLAVEATSPNPGARRRARRATVSAASWIA